MNYIILLIIGGIILYIVGKLICAGKANCNFTLFQLGDTNQCNDEK